MRRLTMSVLAAALTCSGASQAQAAIDAISLPTGNGGVVGYAGNHAVIYKDFNSLVGLGPINVDLVVTSDGDYDIFEDPDECDCPSLGNGFIHNHSGHDWTDFHFLLSGPGLGAEGSRFTGVSTDMFSRATISDAGDMIALDQGTVPNGTDLHSTLHLYLAAPGTYSISELASVPEPSALGLLLLGGGMLLTRRRS